MFYFGQDFKYINIIFSVDAAWSKKRPLPWAWVEQHWTEYTMLKILLNKYLLLLQIFTNPVKSILEK